MPNFLKPLALAALAWFSLTETTLGAPSPVDEAKDWEGESAFYRVFSGQVGEAVKIRLFLSRVGRDLDGYYYNRTDRMPVAVHGEIGSDGAIELTEFPFGSSDQSETTFGRFTGTLASDESEISGRWTPPHGGREVRFIFREDYGGGTLRASLCRMSSRWESRRGDRVVSREKGANFVQFQGDSPGVRRVNASIRAIVEGAFNRGETGRAIDLGVIGDRVTSATAPTLTGLHRILEISPPRITDGSFANSDIESHNFVVIPVLNEAGLLCLRCYWDEYTGGAHPNYWDKYLTFDTLTGTRLRSGDVFRDGHAVAIADLGTQALRRSWGLKPDAPLSEGATFEAGLTLNGNWFIHPGGIGYSFNPYEIGPYSAGFIRFALPWAKVRNWIQPGSPVLRATLTAPPVAGNSVQN